MSTYYCEPQWHDGKDAPASYLVKGQRLASLEEIHSVEPVWKDAPTVSGRGLASFSCCPQHLEAAIHGMLHRYSSVRVLDLN